jgi:hypothetical protein
MPGRDLGQCSQLPGDQRIVHDHQQVDVGAARDVVVEGEGAVQDHPGNGVAQHLRQERASASANRNASSAEAAVEAAGLVERLGPTQALSAIAGTHGTLVTHQ